MQDLLSFCSFISCFKQDPKSQKLIGTAYRRGGLYILDELKVPIVAVPSLDLFVFFFL